MKRVESLVKDIVSLVEVEFKDLQSWAEISRWEVGTTLQIGDTINKKIYQSDRKIRFLTEFPPESEIAKHWHDFSEVCTVLSGTLEDRLSGRKWNVDEKAVFSAGQKHTPYNPSKKESVHLIVDFYKW